MSQTEEYMASLGGGEFTIQTAQGDRVIIFDVDSAPVTHKTDGSVPLALARILVLACQMEGYRVLEVLDNCGVSLDDV